MFTKHDNGIVAALWEGEYRDYVALCHDEADFVGILDDSEGEDLLWVFDGNGWVKCYEGHFITKTKVGENYVYGVIDTPYREATE